MAIESKGLINNDFCEIFNENWKNKPNLHYHIKCEINITFYQIVHENCEENHNFCQKRCLKEEQKNKVSEIVKEK